MKFIVIVANGWNAAWSGCFGNEWITTPHLDRLAAESILFDQHFAINPSIGQWRRSLSSGFFELDPQGPARPSLLALFCRSQFRLVRIQDLAAPGSSDEPWDESVRTTRDPEAPPGDELLAAVSQELDGLKTVEHWILWIETDRLLPPWSVSLDFFDEYAAHMARDEFGKAPLPWDEPPVGEQVLNDDQIDRLQGTFAAVLTEWDADIGRLTELLRQRKLLEDVTLAVTAGHGLALGEHGYVGFETARPHEELTHVPLVLRLPAAEQAGRRVDIPTASIDLLPTLAAISGLAMPADVHGRSLLAVARGSHQPIRPYICQATGAGQALRTPEWAYLRDASAPGKLYRKPEDRWEVYDVRMQHLEWAEYLDELLNQFVAALGEQTFAPPDLKDIEEVLKPADQIDSAAEEVAPD